MIADSYLLCEEVIEMMLMLCEKSEEDENHSR